MCICGVLCAYAVVVSTSKLVEKEISKLFLLKLLFIDWLVPIVVTNHSALPYHQVTSPNGKMMWNSIKMQGSWTVRSNVRSVIQIKKRFDIKKLHGYSTASTILPSHTTPITTYCYDVIMGTGWLVLFSQTTLIIFNYFDRRLVSTKFVFRILALETRRLSASTLW